MVKQQGIRLKKKFGQHFLRDRNVLNHMVDAVSLNENSSVFEIGCGDGVLTSRILEEKIGRLWVFEIDPEWATYVRDRYTNRRLTVFEENILDLDMNRLRPYAPWILLANLPYQITFPIMRMLQKNADVLQEVVVMVQEEVAQKITKKSGKGYGFISLFFQWHFECKLLMKIPPTAFVPPPKVDSRLLYCKPKRDLPTIPDADKFWSFVKLCFQQPRRTLRNNLKQCHYGVGDLSQETLDLRAQQLTMDKLLWLWDHVRHTGAGCSRVLTLEDEEMD